MNFTKNLICLQSEFQHESNFDCDDQFQSRLVLLNSNPEGLARVLCTHSKQQEIRIFKNICQKLNYFETFKNKGEYVNLH